MSDKLENVFGTAVDEMKQRLAQHHRAGIACAGLDLPADVPEGAVKRLVEAARLLAQRSATALTVRADIPLDDARHKTEDALHELGVKL